MIRKAELIIIWALVLFSGCAGVPKIPTSGEAVVDVPLVSFVEVQAHQEATSAGEFISNITLMYEIKGLPASVSLNVLKSSMDQWSGELCVSFWFFPESLCTAVDGGGFVFTFDGLEDLGGMSDGRSESGIPEG